LLIFCFQPGNVSLLLFLRRSFRSRNALQAEILALFWPVGRSAMIARPETVIAWQRKLSPLLYLELSVSQDPKSDSQDESCQSPLGCAPHAEQIAASRLAQSKEKLDVALTVNVLATFPAALMSYSVLERCSIAQQV
jgi:hypothetical protein